jgi:hypothetical protein
MDANDHSWISWLGERDAKVLLLALVEDITAGDDVGVLREMVAGWRANALRALHADNWRAPVDGYLEVWVDARLSPERDRGDSDKGGAWT